MYNVNPFNLIIGESFMQLDGENIHKVIGFEIETGEELVLFRGTWGECRNFIDSIEVTALAQLRHYNKLMDKVVDLTSAMSIVEEELREQEEAYDRLLADYDDEVSKNDKSLSCTGQIENDLLLKIATGKTSRCDAIRFLVEVFGWDYDEARRYVHKIMADN